MPTQKNIKTPEKLYEYFEQYRQHTKDNPRKQPFWNHKQKKVMYLPKEVPLTWRGFEIWLRRQGIIAKLDDYAANKQGRYTEYAGIIRAIKDEIYDDKYTGAVCGLFKENIIARDLGLMERTDHTSKGKEVSMPTKLIIERVEPNGEIRQPVKVGSTR